MQLKQLISVKVVQQLPEMTSQKADSDDHYSMPKVEVSSTARSNFSYSISGDGYGGRSRRLKHVWALQIKRFQIYMCIIHEFQLLSITDEH